MRSYTAISITFITLTSTMAISITRMKSVIRSIIFTMVAKGDSSFQVCSSVAGLSSLLRMVSSWLARRCCTFSSASRLLMRMAISMSSDFSMRSSSRASLMWM